MRSADRSFVFCHDGRPYALACWSEYESPIQMQGRELGSMVAGIDPNASILDKKQDIALSKTL